MHERVTGSWDPDVNRSEHRSPALDGLCRFRTIIAKRRVLQVALCAISGGCAASRVSVTPYAEARQPVALEAVQLFTEREPRRDYDEVALIEVTGNAFAGWGYLIARAREEAAKLGAQAVLVSRNPIQGAMISVDVSTGTAGAAPVEGRKVWAIAAVWREP